MPDDLHRQLKIASANYDESMNVLVMRALREWLEQNMAVKDRTDQAPMSPFVRDEYFS